MSITENQAMRLSTIVANDDGSSYQKVAYYKKENGRLVIKTAKYPTNIISGIHTTEQPVATRLGGSKVYDVNGDIFTISQSQDGYDTRRENHQVSNGLIAMNQYALEMAGFGGKHIDLINGVPVEDFFGRENGSVNKELVFRKADAFKNAVIRNRIDGKAKPTEIDHTRLVTVNSSRVLPEAVGAYYDMLFDDEGSVRTLRKGKTVIVDMGSYTTDICIIDTDGQIIANSVKTMKDKGFLRIFDLIRQAIARAGYAFPADKLPKETIEEAMQTGYINLLIGSFDVRDTIKPVIEKFVDEIVSAVRINIHDDLHYLASIIAVGGGAHLIKEHFGEFKDYVTVPENPQFSNAKGFLKLICWGTPETIIDDL